MTMQNAFLELEKLANQIEGLCPYDDHNELTALNATRSKLLAKINQYFNA
jgi:hypothetical protein